MAKTADVKVSVIDIDSNRVGIRCTVVDGVTGREVVAQILDKTVDMTNIASERAAITAHLMADYEAKDSKADKVAALLATWEAALTADMTALVNA